jgi:hypothetical protein
MAMKIFAHNLVFSILLISGLPSLAFAAFPVLTDPVKKMQTSAPAANSNQGAMEESLAEFKKADPEKSCSANTGAAGQAACLESYKGAKKAIDDYEKAKASGTAEIQALTSQNSTMCGANRTPAGQKACLETTAANYQKAAELQENLVNNFLLAAYNKSLKWQKENETAIKNYQNDYNKIATLENDARNRANVLRSQGDTMAAARTMELVQKAPTASASGISVAAATGAAGSIDEYKGKVPQLSQEQFNAQDYASRFGKATRAEADRLIQQSESFRAMADKARAQAAAVATGGTDPSKSGISDPGTKKLPETGPMPVARPPQSEIDALGRKPGSGVPAGTGTSTSPEPSTYDSNTTNNATPSSVPATQSTTPSALGSAAAATGSGVAAASPTNTASDQFAGMNNQAFNNSGSQDQTAQNNPKSANFGGEVLGTYDPRKKDESNQMTEAEAETKAVESAEQVASAGGLSGASGGEESSGASSSPGIRGADGKPIGFSAAAGGSNLQSSRKNMDRDASAREQFSPDLKSGAVSIAGSEMKSAIQSLAEELGATDLDLNLDDLGAEEKAALAPLEGGDGVRNLAPIKNGRRSASVIQGSDASIQDEQSAALFSRSRSAHERALKRGNLILGTRKKL